MLTLAQLQAIKANILATPELAAQPNNSDGAFAISAYYAVVASPDFWAWRTNITKEELTNSVSVDATTFTWVGNGFITRSVGEQTAWKELGDTINASLANVRQAFSDIFSGTGNAALNRTHLLAVARRKTTRIEKLLATGTGSTASPAVMGFEGTVSIQDVDIARSLP